jgi:cbb3-type cytochrome oxidase subunit 1
MLRGSESESARRERNLSRLLIAFIGSGLAFMLLPGTFLGLWNLFAISSHRSAQSVSDAWVQAHGHAQVFGWIGCFILGIGFHSIPKMTGASSRVALGKAIFCLSA